MPARPASRTEHVVWTNEDRVGLYFLEFGAAPRASSVLYDRKGAAIAGIRPGMVDWARCSPAAKWFHVTGITPALSPAPPRRPARPCRPPAPPGVSTSIDLNYRAKLWSQAEAGRWMTRVDAATAMSSSPPRRTSNASSASRARTTRRWRRLLRRSFRCKVVAITLRENPLVWKNSWTAIALPGARRLRTRTYEVEIVDRLGAGDSFAAGLIHGLLDGDLQKGLDFGVAASALKHSIPGDFAWITARGSGRP